MSNRNKKIIILKYSRVLLIQTGMGIQITCDLIKTNFFAVSTLKVYHN